MYKDFERARMIMADRKQRKGVGFASEEFMGRLPLHVAVAASAPVSLVAELLEDHPEAARTAGPDGRLPLHVSVSRSGLEMNHRSSAAAAAADSAGGGNVELLLKAYPAACDHVDVDGRTPLHICAASGDRSVALAQLLAATGRADAESPTTDPAASAAAAAAGPADPAAAAAVAAAAVETDADRFVRALSVRWGEYVRVVGLRQLVLMAADARRLAGLLPPPAAADRAMLCEYCSDLLRLAAAATQIASQKHTPAAAAGAVAATAPERSDQQRVPVSTLRECLLQSERGGAIATALMAMGKPRSDDDEEQDKDAAAAAAATSTGSGNASAAAAIAPRSNNGNTSDIDSADGAPDSSGTPEPEAEPPPDSGAQRRQQQQLQRQLLRKDSAGCTALHLAAGEGDLLAIELLLAAGPAALAEEDHTGKLPIHWAAMKDERSGALLDHVPACLPVKSLYIAALDLHVRDTHLAAWLI